MTVREWMPQIEDVGQLTDDQQEESGDDAETGLRGLELDHFFSILGIGLGGSTAALHGVQGRVVTKVL